LQRQVGDEDEPRTCEGETLQQTVHDQPPHRRSSWLSLALRLTVRALWSPRLAVDLIRMVWAFRARGWYRRPPFLPMPPREYIRWRMYTAYGDEQAVPPIEDVVRFARWRREVMHL
jgi:hypothetical protein